MTMVWVRDDLTTVVEDTEAVIWVVMENECVYFKANGTMGVIHGNPPHVLKESFSSMWARVL